MNKLYYGDCLAVMQEMKLGSVDLIYLDPPFNSNRAYNAIYRDSTGCELPDQIEAFCDRGYHGQLCGRAVSAGTTRQVQLGRYKQDRLIEHLSYGLKLVTA